MNPKSSPIAFVVLTALAFGILTSDHAGAQQSFRVHLYYETDNLAPPDYLEHVLPPATPGAAVRVAAAISSINAAGAITFANPASYDYRWYHNGRFVSGGRGASTATIFVGKRDASGQNVLLRLYDERGRFIRDTAVEIPLSQPFVTVVRQNDGAIALAESPLTAKPDSTLKLTAVPYFFSVPSSNLLEFVWQSQGRPVTGLTEDPKTLSIVVPANAVRQPISYSVIVSVVELQEPAETVQKNFTVTIQ